MFEHYFNTYRVTNYRPKSKPVKKNFRKFIFVNNKKGMTNDEIEKQFFSLF